MLIKINNNDVEINIKKWTPYTTTLFTKYTTEHDVSISITTDPLTESIPDPISIKPVNKKTKHGKYLLWTEEDDKYLIEQHGKVSNRELCEYLNRSKGAMYGRLKKLEKNNIQTPDETVFKGGEEVEEETKPTAVMEVPKGMETFFEWLGEKKKEFRFKLNDVVNEIPDVDSEMLEKIIIFAIKQGIVLQMSKDVFLKSQKNI